ncbi:acetylornithine transaminase [Vallitalea okinawensis]|uniref:acetylornithine transaminase n=1 Tax=Vallitalea okinawensis TaxID=2078660 RepID=UPI000CFD041E|nr:acetylornithine transaminase [Vallitalea okinawensis]
MKKWLSRGEEALMNTYNSFPVVLHSGEGVYVKDIEGKRYLDFVSGIAVNSLGYGNESFIKSVTNQLHKICHCSNLYYSQPNIEVAEKLIELSGLDKVFFCNSGAEAVEGALKLARQYGKKYKSTQAAKVIAMENSFHGRTYGALTLTGQKKYHAGFQPLLDQIQHVPFNDYSSLEQAIDDDTCAIFLELIQGEGGINMVDQDFLEQVRKLCDDKNILLIFDEVQTGIGRTGNWFAFQNFGIKPDIVTCAKGLGGGFPVGALIGNEKASRGFSPGEHASTFGGNPLAMSAVKAVLEEVEKENILPHVKEVGEYLSYRLNKLKKKYAVIKSVKGIGLIQGIEVSNMKDMKEIINKVMEEGLLLVNAGPKVIRFVPPLVTTKAQIEEGITILEVALKEVTDGS